MKNVIKIALFCMAITLGLSSCEIEKPSTIQITKPLSIADIEFLNAYGLLKTYVDRAANPNFMLSAQASMSDVTDKGLKYRLLASNFDQITLTSGLTHGSVVADNGAYSFGNIPALLPVASDAGISIFGHALVWHKEQGAVYLNDLIKPESKTEWILVPGEGSSFGEKVTNGDFESNLDGWNSWGNSSSREHAIGEGVNGSNCLKFTNPTVAGNSWDAQVEYRIAEAMPVGSKCDLTFMVKASGTGKASVQMQNPSNYAGCGPFGEFDLTAQWTQITLETTITAVDGLQLIFNLGPFAGDIYFDNFSLYMQPVYEEVELVLNRDFESNLDGWNSWGNSSSREHAQGEGVSGSNCLKFTNPSVAGNPWDAQVEYRIAEAMPVGSKCDLTFMVKASGTGKGSVQMQNPSSYAGCGSFGEFDLTAQWTKITLNTTITAVDGLQLIFNLGPFAGDIYFDNFSLTSLQLAGTPDRWEEVVIEGVPKTDEEKYEIITAQLEKWIKAVMEETGNHIKRWTIINEPMDDNNPSQLKTAPSSPAANDFYWQDYLGENYARAAIGFARQYGGNGLKLFVNDYGLTNKAKCDGLTNMIVKWEADGTTKIDGIGAQMSLICSLDAATQKSNEDMIVEMFTSLAQTGKFIRISALNIEIANVDGIVIPTANVTRTQQLVLARYYNFVVRKYFEIIPAALRYGMNIGSPIESTTNAGLWDANYNRKFTFSGFADGLAGRAASAE